jgi:hypothetical protein
MRSFCRPKPGLCRHVWHCGSTPLNKGHHHLRHSSSEHPLIQSSVSPRPRQLDFSTPLTVFPFPFDLPPLHPESTTTSCKSSLPIIRSPPFSHLSPNATSSRSEPYDPYLPRGGSSANPSAPGGSAGPNPKTAHIQAQIDDTVNIMRDNITKVVERQERLDSLQDKTGWCFSSTMPVLPPLFCPSVVGVKPCQYDVDAHTLVLASRQPCRFRSRFQAQRESRPEGTFGFFCFVRYSS